MRDRHGREYLPEVWTEELDPFEVSGDHGVTVFAARIVVTGVDATGLHAEFALSGELCVETASALSDSVGRLVALGVVDVCFDLHDLRLCTSAGIDLWMDLASRLEPRGDVRLRNARGGVRRVLDVVGLSDSGIL